ncbi:DUF1479-domain-containing protein [Obba rivulosa]|uniref:DUF1479-domain-containing protein n=1 Tax=Obba rivulosa TaxID=1052685 RepID=A0A8E2AR73_9APHY|nr:DUF1479-domain-containing protein [Obba rivulosa]
MSRPRLRPHMQSLIRCYATASANASAQGLRGPRRPKKEGTIADVFTLLTSEEPLLPERFAALKKEIVTDPQALVHSWHGVLKELENAEQEIQVEKSTNVSFADIQNGLSEEQLKEIKRAGVIVVRGGVSAEEALSWKQSIREYIQVNSKHGVKGVPPDRPAFYEIYNSPAQIQARTHPAVIETQKYLLTLWKASSGTPISMRTPVSYFDRLRIRPPGPSVFTLGPHIDGGSVERWEDPGFRKCFRKILDGGDKWTEHDPFDATPRLNANRDLYNAPNQCSIFRPWQGWTSLSSTRAGEGTLRVLPFLNLSTAYVMLRPFFRLRDGAYGTSVSSTAVPLDAGAWELDLDSPAFPGSLPRKAQQMRPETHPHLRLDKLVVSIPNVEPGDQVYWHCDLIHAVEAEHNGAGDSSVLYIPAVPLTQDNAAYLRDQLQNFEAGIPPPDFPGGIGEAHFTHRGTSASINSVAARRILGLEPFDVPPDADEGEKDLIQSVNAALF